MDELYNALVEKGIKVRRRGSWLFINCIYHYDSSPSLGIKENRFKCFGCGESGTTDKLLQDLGIQPVNPGDSLYNLSTKLINKIANQLSAFQGIPENFVPLTRTYRNINPQTYRAFNVYESEEAKLFPIYTDSGSYNGYILNNVLHSPKYKNLPLFGYYPYNSHRIISSNLYVVEGIYDALSVYQAGQPNVIAMLGTGNHWRVVQFLQKIKATNVKLILDGDESGYRTAHIIHERYPDSEIITLPDSTDPNSLLNIKDYL